MKRFIKLLLLAIVFSGSFGFAFATKADVPPSDLKNNSVISIRLEKDVPSTHTMTVHSGDAFMLAVHSPEFLAAKITIKNEQQKIVRQTESNLDSGKNVFLFKVGEVKPGIYFIEVETAYSTKLIPVLIQ